MGHLQYRYTLRAANCLADHTYCKQNSTYNLDIITPESSKLHSIEENISRVIQGKQNMPTLTNNTVNVMRSGDTSIKILFKDIPKQRTENTSVIKLDIRNFRRRSKQEKKTILMFCKIQMLGMNFAKAILLAVVYQYYSEYMGRVNLIFTGK